MLTAADNERIVLTVLAQRYGLPLDRVARGEARVVELPVAAGKVQAYAYHGGVVAGAAREHLAVVREELAGDPAGAMTAVRRIASRLGGRSIAVVNRTGVDIPSPAVPVAVTDADDPRLPAWVRGYFTGTAWVVTGDDNGKVLSTAVLKRYDDRLREISVGTEDAARGRGLARAVVAAAARAVLAEGRAVLYNHELGNVASARVAESVGLHELGVLHAVVLDGAQRR